MKYILLIASFNALFYLLLLIQKKSKALHDKILIYWLIYLGLYTGSYAFYSHYLFSEYPLMSSGFISLLMLHGPFLYLYISSLVFHKTRLRKRNLIHFAPFLLFNLYLFYAYITPGASVGIGLEHTAQKADPPLLFALFLIMTVLSGPTYFILSLRLFKKLDSNISENFSYSENVDLKWMRTLVLIFGVIWTVFIFTASIYHILKLFSISFCTDGLFISLSGFIILVGYFGLKQKEIFIHFPAENTTPTIEYQKKYAGSGLKEEDAKEYADILLSHIQSKKSYLNPTITLAELAEEMKIHPHYLSQIINEIFKQNFFDFINQYRVEDVKLKMLDPEYDKFSLLGIAFECGFNSKSAFNRIFKKVTGTTPSQYKYLNSSRK